MLQFGLPFSSDFAPHNQTEDRRSTPRPRTITVLQIWRLPAAPFTPMSACKSVAHRFGVNCTVFCIFDARMVRCRRMLSSRNDTSPHSITARTAQRRSPIKPPERCPHCNSRRLIKKGTRRKKLEDVPLYRCSSCGRTFSIGPRAIRNKTYPLPEILEAFTLYDRGNTLDETAEKIWLF